MQKGYISGKNIGLRNCFVLQSLNASIEQPAKSSATFCRLLRMDTFESSEQVSDIY